MGSFTKSKRLRGPGQRSSYLPVQLSLSSIVVVMHLTKQALLTKVVKERVEVKTR